MISKTFKQEKVGCQLLEAGKAQPYTPGTKPQLGPVWDKSLCVRCALCYIYCPDAAISRQEDGYYDVDIKLCKGCGICHRECWFGAVSMQEVD
ncbi:MAG: 4Fe-4S binding protein [Proteobacteria bacterium]|nr:4Fe-4S binding protein [Pseudomonadota bacterium]